MPFKKGQSGNPAGKPKGAINKKTEAWKDLGDYIINEGSERYLRIISEMEDVEFANRYEKMMEYFKPKQSRTEIESTNTHHITGFDVNIIQDKPKDSKEK